MYSLIALTEIRAAIHRHFTGTPNNRNIIILSGEVFLAADTIFTTMCKKFTSEGNARPQHKDPISQKDMDKLVNYFSDYTTRPMKLEEYVLFTLCFFFGKRGWEKWRELTADFYVRAFDEDGREYVGENTTKGTENNPGGHQQSDHNYSENRMYMCENAVATFKLYKNKKQDKLHFFFKFHWWRVIQKMTFGIEMKQLAKTHWLTWWNTSESVKKHGWARYILATVCMLVPS